MKGIWSGKKRWLVLIPVLVLVGVAVVGWTERETLRTWYVLRGLRQAAEAEVPAWTERLSECGEPAVAGLLNLLAADNSEDAARAERALLVLCKHWGPQDSRTEELAQRLTRQFPHLPPSAQCAALRIAQHWFRAEQPCPERLAAQAGRLLVDADAQPDATVQAQALELGEAVWKPDLHPETRCALRALTQRSLKAPAASTRARAVTLASRPGLELSAEIPALLQDPAPEVRRAALQTIVPLPQVVSADTLLPWLHDSDSEVRRLCERALRQRGLNSDNIRLGRLITDTRWTERVQVLDYLDDAPDLDSAVWLRRLTHDPAPAVRVAALRAASEAHLQQMTDRLDQMAREDPSPTVLDLARHYQRRQRAQNRLESGNP